MTGVCFSAVNELLLHAGVDCSISLEKPHWEEVGYTIFSGVCVCSCVLTIFICLFTAVILPRVSCM